MFTFALLKNQLTLFMKKRLRNFFTVVAGLVTTVVSAQTYSSWALAVDNNNGMYDTIAASGDSLHFRFANAGSLAYTQARLVVYYQGNVGDGNEYFDLFDETLNYQGQVGPNSYEQDCAPEDSAVFYFNTSDINTWNADNAIDFVLVSSFGPGFCPLNTVRAHLSYDYCAAGYPAQFASMSISNPAVCVYDGAQLLTGIPAGGTFSGPGVSGNTFDPVNLTPGIYTLNYVATDSLGCMTDTSITVAVKYLPVVNNGDPLVACYGTAASLTSDAGANSVWFADAAMTQILDTAATFQTPVLTQTTTYWLAPIDKNDHFSIDTVTADNYLTVDVNNYAGDDRGGMAITPNYVYLNGDNHAVRYDLDLNPASVVPLPIRDGIVSDLRTGKLWTLWNSANNTDPQNAPGQFFVTDLRGMDSVLNFTNAMVHLSQPIDMGYANQNNGIFAGFGYVGIYSGDTQHWYVIDIDNGFVTDLGYLYDPELYGAENWSSWGMLESDCNGSFAAVYRDNNSTEIRRRVLPDGTVTTIGNFTQGISDMASLVYNPWNNRWYWHYEGSSSTFGGTNETLGYADVSDTTFTCAGPDLGCAQSLTITVPADVTLNLASNNFCFEDGAVLLNGGAPAGGTYSGIGVGTGPNGTVFFPALSGTGTFTLAYTYTDSVTGCTDVATTQVTVNNCTGIAEETFATGISVYPNPNNGVFTLGVNATADQLLIEVTDLTGRTIYSAQEQNVTPGFTKQISLEGFASGMYMLRLTNGNEQQVRMISVQ